MHGPDHARLCGGTIMRIKAPHPKDLCKIIGSSIMKDTELQSNEYGAKRINQLIPLRGNFVMCIILNF